MVLHKPDNRLSALRVGGNRAPGAAQSFGVLLSDINGFDGQAARTDPIPLGIVAGPTLIALGVGLMCFT